MQQREGDGAGEESLLRQAKHDGGVFADGVEHHRLLELGGDLAEDVDALGLEELQMAEAGRERTLVRSDFSIVWRTKP